MKIKKLYTSGPLVNHYVVKTVDNTFAKFRITPVRPISEADLTPVPFYRDEGSNGEEAPEYIYKLYGLTKD